MPEPTRRDVLRGALAAAALASTGALPGCDAEADPTFPQGVASGDPRPDGVLLWTRVQADDDLPLAWEVARDEGFREVVAHGRLVARAADDHTVRVRVEGLTPGATWWYRFHARGATSPVGRTRTAPDPSDPRPVRVAVACCQDYPGRWFHAWRRLLEEDVDVVLFLGDYIYETARDLRYQDPVPGRTIELPDGMPLDDDPSDVTALTLADYRAIYRTVRADPDLREVHRLFPFVLTWDDHEFANDCWQDHANDFAGLRGDEAEPDRRRAATRAFFEHLPVDLPYAPDAAFPADLRVYRSLRWGSLVEVWLTDQRSYRDDHVVAEGPIEPSVGKLTEDTPLGARILARKDGFDALEAEARPTMLGATQKAWLIDGITTSDAAWKAWASPLMVGGFLLDLRDVAELPGPLRQHFVFKPDQWDGFRTERAEILGALADVDDLVVLSGDLHGFYAGDLVLDFDDPTATPIAAEVTVGSISSASLSEQITRTSATEPLLAAFDVGALVPRLDETLLASNPFLRLSDSVTYGIGVIDVAEDAVTVRFLHWDDVKDPTYTEPSRTTTLTIVRGSRRVTVA